MVWCGVVVCVEESFKGFFFLPFFFSSTLLSLSPPPPNPTKPNQQIGQYVWSVVKTVDCEKKRVDLSFKHLQNPSLLSNASGFSSLFRVGGVYMGRVTKITPSSGLTIQLDAHTYLSFSFFLFLFLSFSFSVCVWYVFCVFFSSFLLCLLQLCSSPSNRPFRRLHT